MTTTNQYEPKVEYATKFQPAYRLELYRFKGIHAASVYFPEKGIILLDGKSGIGKTSFLEALSFLFYDGAGNTCYPRTGRGSKKKQEMTWVRLTVYGKHVIHRQRRPNALSVQTANGTYIDDQAQGYIDTLYGDRKNWLAGGYLRQGEMCSFITMSSNEKLELLRSLAIPSNFDKLLNTTTERIKTSRDEVQKQDFDVRVKKELYMQEYAKFPKKYLNTLVWGDEHIFAASQKYGISIQGLVSRNDKLVTLKNGLEIYFSTRINQLTNEIRAEELRIVKMEGEYRKRQEIIESLSTLEKQLENFGPCPSQNDIADIDKEMMQITNEIAYLDKSEQHNKLMSAKVALQEKLSKIPIQQPKYSQQVLAHIASVQTGPSNEILQKEMEDAEVSIQRMNLQNKYNERISLEAQLQQLQSQYSIYPKQTHEKEMQSLTEKMARLKIESESLTCPSCGSLVQIRNGHLHEIPKTTDVSGDAKIELMKAQQEMQTYEKRENEYRLGLSILSQIETLKTRLLSMEKVDQPLPPPIPGKSVWELNNIILSNRTKLTERSKYNCDVETERQAHNNVNMRNSLMGDIHQLQRQIDNFNVSELMHKDDSYKSSLYTKLSELRKNKQETERKITEYNNLAMKKKFLTDSLVGLAEEVPNKNIISIKTAELETIIKERKEIVEEIEVQMRKGYLTDMYNTYNILKTQFEANSKRLSSLKKIQTTLVTAEYVILDNTLNRLNTVIEEILNQLFDESISVCIRSLRKVKSNDRIKPNINIEIIYKDAEFSSLSELSGGERSRVSLALLIAFANYGKQPYLILDESLVSLDVLTKEKTMKVIRKYLGNKTIIAVNHDTTEGVYDAVIRIN